MVELVRVPGGVAEVGPDRCPGGHRDIGPSWDGCPAGGHRTWRCFTCRAEWLDAGCRCDTPGPRWPQDGGGTATS